QGGLAIITHPIADSEGKQNSGPRTIRPIHIGRRPISFDGENPFMASLPHRSSMAAFFPAAEPIIFFNPVNVHGRDDLSSSVR
ncbi:hypothetical protein ACLOJK_034796, partial [Asimina triloba]